MTVTFIIGACSGSSSEPPLGSAAAPETPKVPEAAKITGIESGSMDGDYAFVDLQCPDKSTENIFPGRTALSIEGEEGKISVQVNELCKVIQLFTIEYPGDQTVKFKLGNRICHITCGPSCRNVIGPKDTIKVLDVEETPAGVNLTDKNTNPARCAGAESIKLRFELIDP